MLIGWGFGPDNYEECVADQAKKGLNRYALAAVKDDCYEKFHRQLTRKELNKLTLKVERYNRVVPGYTYESFLGGTFTGKSHYASILVSVYNGNKKIEVEKVVLKCATSGTKLDVGIGFYNIRSLSTKRSSGSRRVSAGFPTASISCVIKSAKGEIRK